MSLVVIPTAGFGSRLGEITKAINKSLLPFKDKPIISYIIEKFSIDTTFIIPIGYLGQQVIDFCNLVYPERKFIFVDVYDFSSINSGPGYSVRCCLDYLNEPFWYIPCDTFFTEDLNFSLTNNCYFVKKVPQNLTKEYTMFHIKNSLIQDIRFKETTDESYMAFTGVMYIHNYKEFKNRLISRNSPEIISVIDKNEETGILDTWLDFGNKSIYENSVNMAQKYNFTKKDEITYFPNGKVVKWWNDPKIAEKKFLRVEFNKDIFPFNVKMKNNFICYDHFEGNTLYQKNNLEIFINLLNWLSTDVWKISRDQDKRFLFSFYKLKTDERIKKFIDKYPDIQNVSYINNIKVSNWQTYYNRIDWNSLVENSIIAFIHGDLQFDNIIIDNNWIFKIIDWRQEFADSIIYGDLYYDLAKLLGGLVINYSEIKENKFNFTNENDRVLLDIPYVKNFKLYKEHLIKFSKDNNYDFNKVDLLVPIIFWNMSPLHNYPFDKFLWYLGILLFEEYFNDYR